MDDALANIKGLDHSGIVGLDELGPGGAEDKSDQAHVQIEPSDNDLADKEAQNLKTENLCGFAIKHNSD